MKNEEIYKIKRYFGMAVDPIHIGTGGYRLGRVDNTIVKESGTNLPKIPGTTIEGCARTYSYYKEKEKNREINEACAVGKKTNEKQPCGECAVCISYGFAKEDKSLHGMAQFSDARILLFPVNTILGPAWITSPNTLEDVGINKFSVSENKIKTKLVKKKEKLNLGWLYLENEEEFSIPNNKLNFLPNEIRDRIVLVSEKLFSQLVNSNLEVRTSVAINPVTGAAEEGALFTYEAIPRSTIFWFDIIFNNPLNFDVKNSMNINEIENTVENGLKLFEILGIGGMQTRGFGRLRILNLGGENAKH